MKLKCLVIDDSSIQRTLITKLVNNHLNLKLDEEFSNAFEAVNYLKNNTVDLIFLDIEMPDINGFEFLDGLKIKPQIIFITSKAEYALKAFEYDATDYLQKPLLLERFNTAIERVIELQLLKNGKTEDEGDFIFIKSNLKTFKLYVLKIKWVEAYGDYVRIFTDNTVHTILSTMKSFENELPSQKFIRIHKSYIINIEKVARFNGQFVEIGSDKIPMSRNKKDELIKALENV